MQNAQVPVLGFAANSGSGKTTLITQLIPILKQNNLRIGLIKHSHHNFAIDKPGKDSFRFREAGADTVMLVSRQRRAIITEIADQQEPHLDDQFAHLDQTALDLILVEGFKAEKFPKIEVHRTSLGKPLLYHQDPTVIAVASDTLLNLPASVIALDLNTPSMIADYILKQFLGSQND